MAIWNKVRPTADEKLVNNFMLYKDSTGHLFWKNETTDLTKGLSKAEVINLFKKGLILVSDGDDFFVPQVCEVETNYAKVSLVVMGTSAAEVKAFYSKEYSA